MAHIPLPLPLGATGSHYCNFVPFLREPPPPPPYQIQEAWAHPHGAPGSTTQHQAPKTLSQATHTPLLLRHPLGQVGISLQQAAESSQGVSLKGDQFRLTLKQALRTTSFEPPLMGNQMDLHVG